MTQFEGREKAYENEFVRNEEFDFKVNVRKNKLLGLWAASHMGLSGAQAEEYYKEVIKSDFEEVGDEDVYRKLKADLDAKGVNLSEHQIKREMADQMEVARAQMTEELKDLKK